MEEVWEEFWKPIVWVDGKISLEQIKRELYDYYLLMDNVSRVYTEVSGYKISKITTDPDEVIREFHAQIEEAYNDGYQEGLAEAEARSL